MRRGRPRAGVELIDHLAEPPAVRRRVKVVLGTLTGAVSPAEACAQLGIGRSRLYALRRQMLRGALDALRAHPRGRPRHVTVEDGAVRALRARVRELELALHATQLRSEIALTMPFLLDRAGAKKKGGGRLRASGAHPVGARRARSRGRTT